MCENNSGIYLFLLSMDPNLSTTVSRFIQCVVLQLLQKYHPYNRIFFFDHE